jgi:hypothetical protein
MGKKLTSWQKSQREREKERERNVNARKVEARRREQREKKERELKTHILAANKADNDFQELIKIIKNVCYQNVDEFQPIGQFSNHSIFKKVQFSSKLLVNELSLKDLKISFYNNPKIKELIEISSYSLDDYKRFYSNFFKNIFYKKKLYSEYSSFISDTENEISALEKSDFERKKEFDSVLEELKNIYVNINENQTNEANLSFKEFEKSYSTYLENFQKYQNSIQEFEKIKNEAFNTPNSHLFQKYFNANLPIKFIGLDKVADNLLKSAPKIGKDFYTSPSNHLKLGIKFTEQQIEIFIVFKEDYFPIKDRQVNLLKNDYSITEMTKKLKSEIVDPFYNGLYLIHAFYAIKVQKLVDNIVITMGIDGHDSATGKSKVFWKNSKMFTRKSLVDILYDKIDPTNTIKLFPTVQILNYENINWITTNNGKLGKTILDNQYDKIIELEKSIKDTKKFTEPYIFNIKLDKKALEKKELLNKLSKVKS